MSIDAFLLKIGVPDEHAKDITKVLLAQDYKSEADLKKDVPTLEALHLWKIPGRWATVISKELSIFAGGVQEPYPRNGEEAWARLSEANNRYVNGSISDYLANLGQEITAGVREENFGGQHPYAVILTCSDSRVSPEIIFGEGLGLLFVVRVAGNVLDPVTMGSVEYAVENLKTPLLVIMGHEKCGAVAAAAGSIHLEGGVGQIVSLIQPAVKFSESVTQHEWWKQKEAQPQLYNEVLDKTVKINVLITREVLLRSSPILAKAEKEKRLLIVPAEYHIKSGLVNRIVESEVSWETFKYEEHFEKHHRAHKKRAKEERLKSKHHHKSDHKHT